MIYQKKVKKAVNLLTGCESTDRSLSSARNLYSVGCIDARRVFSTLF